MSDTNEMEVTQYKVKRSKNKTGMKIIINIVCILLAILSILPFWVMIVNSTRSTTQIQQHALSLIPGSNMVQNFKILTGKTFNPAVGLMNSIIISVGATVLTVYFSSLTAYAMVAYDWKLKNAFFKFIIGVMMIPAQVTMIGFYQMVYKIGMTNKLSIHRKVPNTYKFLLQIEY